MEPNAALPVETRPVNKLALIALRELHKNVQAAEQEILAEAAALDGIDPALGWGFDARSGQWMRQVPTVTE